MHFHHFDFVSFILLVTVGALSWFAADMRSILKSGQVKNQLSIDGRWEDLENHFRRTMKPRRFFVWLHQRYLLPGNLEGQYALFLYQRGRSEEALAKMDEAQRKIANKPRIFAGIFRRATSKTLWGALNGRILILSGLGRYDEARQVAVGLQNLGGPVNESAATMALLEANCGRLDAALEWARTIPSSHPQFDSMQIVMAWMYSSKGEFEKAVEVLQFESGDISKFYDSRGLTAMKESVEGSKLLELQQKKLTGVRQPARLLMLASTYISHEKFDLALVALEQAEKTMGKEPVIQCSYCRLSAVSVAATGKVLEAEDFIKRALDIARKYPKRSTLWETHLGICRTYWYLKRYGEALAAMVEGEKSALHPIEKHSTAYWLARTHEAAGRRQEAKAFYEAVVADGIPSWMRKRAEEALANPGNE